MATVDAARVRACATTLASWSISPFTGMNIGHKPEPRLPRVTSP